MSQVDSNHPEAQLGSYTADRLLVERLVVSDAGAWQTFIQTYGRIIRSRVADVATSFGRGADESAIDDATAEVFAALLSNDAAALRAFAGRSSLGTYVAVIATRSATRGFAAKRPISVSHDGPQHPEQSGPAGEEPSRRLMDQEQRQRVHAMLEKLPPRQRDVVRLFHLDGYSYAEVSARLGIPIGSIGVTLRRAEAKLKEMMEPD